MARGDLFKYFRTSRECIRVAVMMYVRFPRSLRNVEDVLHECGIDVSHEAVRFWWHRFGPMFAAESRQKRAERLRSRPQWRWHLDGMFVRISGERHYLWRAVDHEGEVLENPVTKTRDRKAALKFIRKPKKRCGRPEVIETDRLRTYGTAAREIGAVDQQETGRWLSSRAENSHLPFRRRERAMQRFQRMRRLQMFAAVHTSVFNYFNSECGLSTRANSEKIRAAALAG
ncbi:IS6 family transposase [Pseudoruegeria marinistellae]|uniref:IS6 family transposase n=1 Tax=Tropicimonas marinistellae TaxID=1739787 RepID=UPI0008307E8B